MESDGGTIFIIIWFIVIGFIVITLYKRGKKAKAIFPDMNTVNVKYRDKFASGYSSKSFMTKIGGADKTLDIVVTDKELWLKSGTLFASIAQRYDLHHRISLEKINKVERKGNKIIVDFIDDKNESKQVVLITKRPDEFMKYIRVQNGK